MGVRTAKVLAPLELHDAVRDLGNKGRSILKLSQFKLVSEELNSYPVLSADTKDLAAFEQSSVHYIVLAHVQVETIFVHIDVQQRGQGKGRALPGMRRDDSPGLGNGTENLDAFQARSNLIALVIHE